MCVRASICLLNVYRTLKNGVFSLFYVCVVVGLSDCVPSFLLPQFFSFSLHCSFACSSFCRSMKRNEKWKKKIERARDVTDDSNDGNGNSSSSRAVLVDIMYGDLNSFIHNTVIRMHKIQEIAFENVSSLQSYSGFWLCLPSVWLFYLFLGRSLVANSLSLFALFFCSSSSLAHCDNYEVIQIFLLPNIDIFFPSFLLLR